MKKMLAFICLSVFVSTASAQTMGISYPFVNPFGEKLCDCPYGVASYGKGLGSGWSFFGLLGSSVNNSTSTVTYVSFSKTVTISSGVNLSVGVGDFRAFRPGSFLHWGNINGHLNVTVAGGNAFVMTDMYFGINGRGDFMNLTGVGYETPMLYGFRLRTRLGYVNYAQDLIWDTKFTYKEFGPVEPFVRGVVGYDKNVSAGIALSF